jgi:hypothetical protein
MRWASALYRDTEKEAFHSVGAPTGQVPKAESIATAIISVELLAKKFASKTLHIKVHQYDPFPLRQTPSLLLAEARELLVFIKESRVALPSSSRIL